MWLRLLYMAQRNRWSWFRRLLVFIADAVTSLGQGAMQLHVQGEDTFIL